MPTSVQDIVSRMRQALAISEPDLDTTIGTPVRKILDAVAEVVAESSVDTYLLDYQYDIESKTGSDLDDFVSLFGFSRLSAKRAVGTVIFERTSAASLNDYRIELGTQVATGDTNPVVFQTLTAAILLRGETSVSVPMQAVLGGAGGNVAANSIQRRVTQVVGISSVSNPTAMTGGADAESDAQLRDRFKRTVFRNLAGTEQMFLGVALDDVAVTQANVIGASKRHREQVEVVGTTATSTIADAKYIYDGSAVMGSDIDAGKLFVPGVDFTFNTASATVTVLNPSKIPPGIYDLEFEYLPFASRNDPTNGVTNRIDVYVNGSRPTRATTTLLFRTTRAFSVTGTPATNLFHRNNFERADGTHPIAGNFFIAFPFGPVIDPSVDDVITIGGNPYVEDQDYWLVNDITANGGTPHSFSGIEFSITPGDPPGSMPVPPNATAFSVDYAFNAVPRDVDLATRVWRLITTDVQVHAAKLLYLDLYVAVMVTSGYSAEVIQPTIEAALADYISRVGFNGVVQVSDLLGVIQRVPGVDAVRFLTSNDPYNDVDDTDHWAIERMSSIGTYLSRYADGTPEVAVDIVIGDDELPVFNSLTIVLKAQNTFYSYLGA